MYAYKNTIQEFFNKVFKFCGYTKEMLEGIKDALERQKLDEKIVFAGQSAIILSQLAQVPHKPAMRLSDKLANLSFIFSPPESYCKTTEVCHASAGWHDKPSPKVIA